MSGANNSDIFDPEMLDSLHDAVGDGINKIISIYVDDFPNTIAKMHQSLANNDIETVGRLAHSLKSSSGNLGAKQLVDLSLNLEGIIKNGVWSADQISLLIDQLEQAFMQIQPRLIGYIR